MPAPLILIVDDNPDEIAITGIILADLRPQVRIHGVATGEDAMRFLEGGERPACVLLDLKLPGINGLEVTRRIRATRHLRDLPVVIFTSSSLAADVEASLAAGADAFLHKALDVDRYTEELDTLLKRFAVSPDGGGGA